MGFTVRVKRRLGVKAVGTEGTPYDEEVRG